MNKTKRVLSVLLSAAMLISLAAAFAVADDSLCTIIINYVFEDGTQAANPWTATIAKGTSYNKTVSSPTVVGYTPDNTSVEVNVADASGNETYKVTYRPALVSFTVNHYTQNVENDKYTLAETETKTGYTKDAVGDSLKKTYPGFTALLYDTTTLIAADGSTVVEIYYDRNFYLISFELGGGYGTEPMFAKYGDTIRAATPVRAGYTFEGWEPELTSGATVPAENKTYTAKWKAEDSVNFSVVFWYENADDTLYSYAGSLTESAAIDAAKSSDDYQNADFTGKDSAHFTYNSAKAETVTVKADGSSVLNVYFTRNTYTLTFKELTCTKTSWFHSHTDSCYEVVTTITAKYGADIHSNFPIKDGDETIWWTVPSGCESFEEGNYLGSIDTMPGENITFMQNDSESGAKIYYYVETLGGATGDTAYNGKNYKLYKVIDLDYSSSVNLTYKEEFHPITGFTQGDSNPTLPKDGQVSMEENNYLYYTRNSYNLKFYNYDAELTDKAESVQYEAALSGYDFTPEYPANLEPNAYEFARWYTTAGCYDGSEANLSTMTMPASDMMLYAKWAPVTHTVTFALKEGSEATQTEQVAHGSEIDGIADPTNGNYTFIGWFYKDENGVEHAFTLSMPVKKDLNLYAKWSSNTLVSYTVNYKCGEDVIAEPTTGSALAGTTKTFEAKVGIDLKNGYQEGYFPATNSHSIVMDIDGANEYTFEYVKKAAVKYTVKYLEAGTNNVLHAEKTAETTYAVITEKFEQVALYAPDAYQKRLVLSINEDENVIIFLYQKDETHAPVQVTHYIQNIAGEGYSEYQYSTNLNGVIGQEYSENALTIPGFAYNAEASTASGTLTEEGLELKLYYDRIEYPYEFRFVNNEGTAIATSITGNARYGAQVTQNYINLESEGWLLNGSENGAITIAIEDGETAVKNVYTFKYDPFYTVKHVQSGTVAKTDKNIITNGNKVSLTNAVSTGYLYGGAFTNEACTEAQTFTNDENAIIFTPTRGATYYIWEVNEKYLVPKTYTIARTDVNNGNVYQVTDLYLLTAADRALYKEVGFEKGEANILSETLYGKISVVYYVSHDLKEELYVKDGLISLTAKGTEAPSDRDAGYIAVYKLTDNEFDSFRSAPFTFTPYWITLDGIMVTGTKVRTCTFTEGAKKIVTADTVVASAETLGGSAGNEGLNAAASFALTSMEGAAEEATVTPDETEIITEPIAAPDMTYTGERNLLRVRCSYTMLTNSAKLISALDTADCIEAGFIVNGVTYKCESFTDTVSGYGARYLFGESAEGAMLMSLELPLEGFNDGQSVNITPYMITADGTTVYGETFAAAYRAWQGLAG
jgi:uncharacterized repeat protein (TIGR02543 family)